MGKSTTAKPELGKWALWKFFAAAPAIRPYLPPTTVFNKISLKQFMGKYDVVYIKPMAGSQGRGIVKAWKGDGRFYFVKERGKATVSASVEDLYRKIRLVLPGIPCVIQKGIPLAEVNGRPIDIRLMMMRDETRKWKYIGMVAKVAGQQSIITNVARGKGYVLEVDEALQRSLGIGPDKIAAIKKELIQLGYKSSQRFDDYKRYWQLGFDVAVDKNGKVWMIEENTGPAHSLFYKLKDKTTYRQIRKIANFWWSLRRKQPDKNS